MAVLHFIKVAIHLYTPGVSGAIILFSSLRNLTAFCQARSLQQNRLVL